MRMRRLALQVGAALALSIMAPAQAETLRVDPHELNAVRRIDERFQSYNVEMAEIIGGRFWRPYADNAPRPTSNEGGVGGNSSLYAQRPPIDLSNRRLRVLTRALGPAYIRVSGSWANTVYFQNDDNPRLASAPEGYQNVLTRSQWRGVIDFARAVDAKLVISYAINPAVRDAEGVWTPVQARPFMDYTRSIGGEIYAAELFNEPNFSREAGGPADYSPSLFARDIAAFRTFAAQSAPTMRIVGPGDTTVIAVGRSPTTEDFLQAEPRSRFDIFSYHFYGAISQRCAPPTSPMGVTPERAMTDEWLARTDGAIQPRLPLRDRYAPNAPVWLTEVAGAACGGSPHSATFADTFRYLDQAGRLAKQGVDAIFHNTLAASEYGLIDEHSWEPRPNYWAALLWRRLMGETVLDAGALRPGMHLYAHCLRGRRGGVALLAINLSDEVAQIETAHASDVYQLSAPQLDSTSVLLNNQHLAMRAHDRLPNFRPSRVRSGAISVTPQAIAFIAIPGARNAQCM